MNKQRVHPLAPVVGLDIDGTLGDYYGHFHRFAEQYLQEPLDVDWKPETNQAVEFSDALDLPKSVYRDIKLAYRQGGMKRSLPVLDDHLMAMVQNLRREKGLQVWICTTRPWQRLDNIDPDTQFWLNRNVGRVDGVIYGEEKYEDLIDIVGRERIIGIFDDLPENVEEADALGLRSALRAGDHNAWWTNSDAPDQTLIDVVHSAAGIYETVQRWIENGAVL
jgi:FMN phosphatase YigB (HAD superfamily)